MSDSERDRTRSTGRFTADHWAWILLPVMAASFFAWLLGLFIRRAFALDVPQLPVVIGCLGGALGTLGSVFIYRIFARTHDQAQADAHEASIEVIEVIDPLVVQQEEFNDEGPIFYFDIGDGQLLFLWGQWMYDPHIFWRDGHAWAAEVYDDLEDVPDESLAAPFPSSHFILHRTTNLGIVTRIDLLGARVAPVHIIPTTAVPLSDLPPSCTLSGSLQDLPAAVATGRVRSL